MWILLSLLGLTIFLIWCLSSPFYWRIRKVPYLTPLPIFGNFFSIIIQGIAPFYGSLHTKFPNERFYGMHFFTRPMLYIKDPNLIQQILIKDFDYFTSHGIYGNQERDPLTRNLFHIYGQQWKEMRSKISPYFTPAKVKAMLGYVDNTVTKATKVIDTNIGKKEEIELNHILMTITIDVITQAIFGIESDTFQNKDSPFLTTALEMFSSKSTSKILVGIISPKVYDFFQLILLSDDNKERIMSIVTETMAYRKREKITRQDYLQGMMELIENGLQRKEKYFSDNTPIPRYDFETLLSQAMLLFAAGVETTALTLTYFFYEMALHPDIQQKCRNEINSVCHSETSDILIGDLSKLVYLQATIEETLRVHAPLDTINRECTKQYKIPGTDVIIDKGTAILMTVSSAHMNPKYYPQPEIFRPERFLDNSKIDGGTFFPFGLGPRTCIGMGLAYGEMKLVSARFLRRYEFSVCSKTDIPAKSGKYNLLKTPANGMWLNVRQLRT